MRSKARKKAIRILAGTVLLLLIACLLVACNGKYRLSKSVTVTQLVPPPDEIVYGSHSLSGDACETLYRLLTDRLELDENNFELYTFDSAARRKLLVQNCAEISLCFNTPRKLQKNIEAAHLSLSEDFEFDQIKILLHQVNGLFLEFYLDGELYLFQGELAVLHHTDLVVQNKYTGFFDSTMAESIIGLLPHTVSNEEPVVSNAFPAMPDSIVLYANGNAVTLQQMEKIMVFEMISSLLAKEVKAGSDAFVSQEASSIPALETVKGRVFVELRYNKPQKYVADTIEESSWGNSISTVTYESLLLGFNPCNDEHGLNDHHIIYKKDGKYDWWPSYNRHRSSPPELTPLYAYVYLRTYLTK